MEDIKDSTPSIIKTRDKYLESANRRRVQKPYFEDREKFLKDFAEEIRQVGEEEMEYFKERMQDEFLKLVAKVFKYDAESMEDFEKSLVEHNEEKMRKEAELEERRLYQLKFPRPPEMKWRQMMEEFRNAE